jgi:aldehyde dehydrogenase (NAD+)
MALVELAPENRNLIDGKLVDASNGNTFENVNPSTEEVLGTVADGTKDDMERAVAVARRTFDESEWSIDPAFRQKCLRQLYQGLLEEKEQFRSIVVHEVGAPVSTTPFMQVDEPIEMVAYWAELAGSFEYEKAMSDVPFLGRPQRRILRREPVGVVGAITPWNVPFYLNLTKIASSIGAGNTCVLKPAPDTPWSGTHIGKVIAEKTDIPPGVIQIVASSDHGVGEVLSTDPRIDAVSFTGSTQTGRRIMACAAETVKKVFLELGGKSATIVLDDADFNSVCPGAAMTCIHGGQGCAIATRWLVPRARYDEATELMKTAFEGWNYGDPTNPANLQGPQVSRQQQERVLSYIEKGKAEGARCLVGGGKPEGKGFFVEPTLFVDVDPKMTIAQEEIFGPVLCVIPYEDDADAIRIANDSVYGLSGGIQGGDEARALRVARQIRTGTLAVNGGQWFHVDTPFGGYKQSGVGRENGVMGFEELLETKVIALPGK